MELETKRLIIRDIVNDDLSLYHKLYSDKDNTEFTNSYILDESHLREKVQRWIKLGESQERYFYKLSIFFKDSDEFVGECSIHVHETKKQICTVGWTIDKTFWGNGIATEVGMELISYAHKTLNCHRVWAECDYRNRASERVLQKIGMIKEGLLRKNNIISNEWSDTLIYAIVFETDREIL